MSRTLDEFLASYFKDDISTDTPESDIAVGVAAVVVLVNNPRRVRAELTNTGPTTIALRRDNTVTPTTGDIVAPGETWEMNWLTGLDSTMDPIFAISSGAGGLMHVRETLLI